jgi:Na+-driven multidrug efflux pump
VVITLLAQIAPSVFIKPFTTDAKVIEVGTDFLRIISWNFIGTGIIFTCSGMFQAMGNTWPALLSGASRLLIFGVPAVWLSMQPSFHLDLVWEVSVATVIIQAVLSYALLQVEMRKKLAFATPAAVPT